MNFTEQNYKFINKLLIIFSYLGIFMLFYYFYLDDQFMILIVTINLMMIRLGMIQNELKFGNIEK